MAKARRKTYADITLKHVQPQGYLQEKVFNGKKVYASFSADTRALIMISGYSAQGSQGAKARITPYIDEVDANLTKHIDEEDYPNKKRRWELSADVRDGYFTIDFRTPILKRKYLSQQYNTFALEGTEATAQIVNVGDKTLYQTYITQDFAIDFSHTPIIEAFMRIQGVERVESIKKRSHQWGPMKGRLSLERAITVKFQQGYDIEKNPVHVLFVDMTGNWDIEPFHIVRLGRSSREVPTPAYLNQLMEPLNYPPMPEYLKKRLRNQTATNIAAVQSTTTLPPPPSSEQTTALEEVQQGTSNRPPSKVASPTSTAVDGSSRANAKKRRKKRSRNTSDASTKTLSDSTTTDDERDGGTNSQSIRGGLNRGGRGRGGRGRGEISSRDEALQFGLGLSALKVKIRDDYAHQIPLISPLKSGNTQLQPFMSSSMKKMNTSSRRVDGVSSLENTQNSLNWDHAGMNTSGYMMEERHIKKLDFGPIAPADVQNLPPVTTLQPDTNQFSAAPDAALPSDNNQHSATPDAVLTSATANSPPAESPTATPMVHDPETPLSSTLHEPVMPPNEKFSPEFKAIYDETSLRLQSRAALTGVPVFDISTSVSPTATEEAVQTVTTLPPTSSPGRTVLPHPDEQLEQEGHGTSSRPTSKTASPVSTAAAGSSKRKSKKKKKSRSRNSSISSTSSVSSGKIQPEQPEVYSGDEPAATTDVITAVQDLVLPTEQESVLPAEQESVLQTEQESVLPATINDGSPSESTTSSTISRTAVAPLTSTSANPPSEEDRHKDRNDLSLQMELRAAREAESQIDIQPVALVQDTEIRPVIQAKQCDSPRKRSQSHQSGKQPANKKAKARAASNPNSPTSSKPMKELIPNSTYSSETLPESTRPPKPPQPARTSSKKTSSASKILDVLNPFGRKKTNVTHHFSDRRNQAFIWAGDSHGKRMGRAVMKASPSVYNAVNIGIGGIKLEQWIDGKVTSKTIPSDTPLVEIPSLPALEAIIKSRDHLISSHVGDAMEITVIIFIGHNDFLKFPANCSTSFVSALADKLSVYLGKLQNQLPDLKMVYALAPPFGTNKEMVNDFNCRMSNYMEASSIKVIGNKLLKRSGVPDDPHATDASYRDLFYEIATLSQ